MNCLRCQADNPPGRSTCTMCSQPFGARAKSEKNITKDKQAFVPELLSRAPGSALYVIVDPERFEKTNFWGKKVATTEVNPHGLDLATIDKREWRELFARIIEKNTNFAISSHMAPSLDEMLDLDGVRDKVGLFMLGSKELHLELHDGDHRNVTVLDLPISSIDQVVEVAYDFLHRPSELLDLYSWIDYSDRPEQKPAGPNSSTNVATVVTTTFFISEDFEF